MRLGLVVGSFALLLSSLAACSSESDPHQPAGPAGGAAGTGSSGAAGSAGLAGTAGMAGTAGVGGGGAAGSAGAAGTGGGGTGGQAGGGGGAGPALLSETGLYSEVASETLAEGVLEYAPAYQLWTDGAEKRRWVYLPAGATIDTTDMDYWVYPVGTKLWKEFSRDGVRVETRLIEKLGEDEDDWFMMAYQWNEDGSDAVAVPGGMTNAKGTQHDIPDQMACHDCHDNMADRVLGFSALQLSHDGEGVTLADLIASGRLSNAPAGNFQIQGTDVERAALGYLHANCGHCHNDSGEAEPFVTIDMQLWLHTGALGSPEQTATYQTTIDQPTESYNGKLSGAEGSRVTAMDPAKSELYLRFTTENTDLHMPPLGTEVVDPEGENAILDWINGLQP